MGNIHANQQLPEDQVMVNANETVQANQLVGEHQAVANANANANANESDDDGDDAWDPQELDDESHVELDDDTDADVISMADSDILVNGLGSTRAGAGGNGNANDNANNNTNTVETSNTVETKIPSNGKMKFPIWVCLQSEDSSYGECYDGGRYSDWQIDVRFHDSMDVTSYLVHRFCIGPQSAYFNMIFRDEKSFLESNSKRSFIEFPENAPVAIRKIDFDLFLYYLYSNNKEHLIWVRPHVLSMLYLADYFGVDKLRTYYLAEAKRLSSEDEFWAGTAYCFAESMALKDMKVDIQKLCYTQNEYKHSDIWNAIPDQGWKRNLLKGIQKLWNKDLSDGNVDESKAKRWYSIVGGFLQYNPDLVDSCLLLEIQVDLARDRDRFGVGRLLEGRYALEYLKRERELGLDAPEMDGLTTFQEEFVQSFVSKKPDVTELPDIIEALQDLKPSITKNLLCFCLQNNN